MWAGRMKATALPTKQARGHVGLRAPRTATQYRANRTATAASPKTVIPKIRPAAHTLKNGPEISGMGASTRQARNPNRKAGRDAVPFRRRTSVPVIAAAASNSTGSTTM